MSGQRQSGQGDKLREFIGRIRREAISSIPTSALVKPKGYASEIARSLKITRVQLRRVYSELKYVFDRVKQEGTLDEEVRTKMYMLYPVLEYQKNRGVIDGRFVELMFALLENLEKYETKENFEKADRFLTALVAYTKEA